MKFKFKIKFKFLFKKVCDFLRCYCFRLALAVFVILMLVNLAIYIIYVSWPVRSGSKSEIKQETINDELLQKVTENLNVRAANLERVNRYIYPDPFK